ncbi:hypothetical protein GCM10007901_20530 [Dyella acidisoli]|uniref:Uncharacterized protein n=1 Tax=Dyella acidisoli TaxID=1867834 RepID=A0ABQ5XP07_9GAMM|nr:hypothetical protein GCM10007901_20530 [Dyella acidisoli]
MTDISNGLQLRESAMKRMTRTERKEGLSIFLIYALFVASICFLRAYGVVWMESQERLVEACAFGNEGSSVDLGDMLILGNKAGDGAKRMGCK